MKRDRIRIPGDWRGRDRHLEALARKTGHGTLGCLASFVLYEVSRCKTPAQFYRAVSKFHDAASEKR
jgi:hypothetical protein